MTQHTAQLDEKLNEALNPDEVEWDTFLKVLSEGKTAKETGEIRIRLDAGGLAGMVIRPINHKWDRLFRKYAMPMLGSQLQPLEMLFGAIVRDEIMVATEMGITKSLIASELEVDDALGKAVGAICASQDPEQKGKTQDKPAVVEKWGGVVEEYLRRDELVKLVEVQARIQKEIFGLGESLAARFRILQSLVGDKINLSALALDSIKSVGRFSGLPGEMTTTLPNSGGESTESSSMNTSKTPEAPAPQ